MMVKHSLTSEKLKDRFDNPFALVNYAISLAKARIQRGEGLETNPAMETLEVIARGDDIYDLEDEEDDEDEDLEG